jgi:hypothetical protein
MHLRRDMCSSTTDGASFSMMVGLSETYFSAFYLTAGMSNLGVGILATVPVLLGSLLQLLTPWGVEWVGSYRRWMVMNASLQATSLCGLAYAAATDSASFWVLLGIVTIYWGSGLATAPVWNTWIETLIPASVRAKFLARRMRICQFCLLLGVTTAGCALRWSESWGQPLSMFAVLLAGAGVCRYVSASMLNRKSELTQPMRNRRSIDPTASINPASPPISPTSNSATAETAHLKAIPYFLLVQFAVFLSGPYFTPFMLRVMQLSFLEFTVLIVLGYLGRIAALSWASKVTRYFGQATLLWVGGISIIPASGLWIFYESYWFLCCLQFVFGMAWACYELALALVLVERIPQASRVQVISRYNLFNSAAMVTGSVIGGSVVQWFGESATGFLVIFVASTFLRVIALLWFPFALFQMRSGSSAGWIYMFYPTPEPNGRTFLRPFYVFSERSSETPVTLESAPAEDLRPS